MHVFSRAMLRQRPPEEGDWRWRLSGWLSGGLLLLHADSLAGTKCLRLVERYDCRGGILHGDPLFSEG